MRVLFFLILVANGCGLASAQKTGNRNYIWDNRPATDWMTQAYPVGNGRLGAMIFGGVGRDRIQFNENSLWTGDEQETGAYQAFGELSIDFDDSATMFNNYRRTLDLNDAMCSVKFAKGHTVFERTYFASYPDQIVAIHYTSNNKSSYSAHISLKDAHNAITKAVGDRLLLNDALGNGLKYAAAIAVKHSGGRMYIKTDGAAPQIRLEKVDQFTILLSAATNYSNQRARNWRGADPLPVVDGHLNTAVGKNFNQLKSAHLNDYRCLFDRVSLSLGKSPDKTNLSTRERILQYTPSKDPGLESLLFQYGRYLLISSSRKGGLPANLQGLWNNSNNPPWRSDYHSNINIQMNYWLAEPTNLSELHYPYLDYINSMREVKKIHTQKQYKGVRGWTVKTENNIFGGESFLWNTPGSAWYAQALWEHYAFTGNKEYLKDFAYPILKEITEFWDDHLVRRPDGTVVAPMGWSPEHGPREDGVSHDQQIVYDLFTNYVEASDSLQIDRDYRNHIDSLKARLLAPKIGRWGQLQEWETDRDDPTDRHRHVSHLFALHPGRQISVVGTPSLAEAARVSLVARGDASTGWSMAWKMNFWARLLDGDHAYAILNNFITLAGSDNVNYDNGGGIYSNLLCAHPPFQIDGNFGYTAGVTEMLLQSHTGSIHVLPALPRAWPTGAVRGLKARGGFEILELSWENGKVSRLVIRSLLGRQLRLITSLPLKGKLNFEKQGGGYVASGLTKPGELLQFSR